MSQTVSEVRYGSSERPATGGTTYRETWAKVFGEKTAFLPDATVVFMTACGFTMPCVQVLALDRHGKAAGTAQSILGAANFGVAGIISPLVGWLSVGSGITATTMATVMVGCAVIGILALWILVRPRTVERLAP